MQSGLWFYISYVLPRIKPGTITMFFCQSLSSFFIILN